MHDLDERVALITGGGRGIGRALALRLAKAGAKVSISDLNIDLIERVRAEIEADGGVCMAVSADIANKFQCVNHIETTRENWGRIDIVVNAASVAPSIPLYKLDEWDFVRALDVMLKGSFFMTQLCGRVMEDENRERGGSILNIGSSIGTSEGMAGQTAYSAAKAAIIGLTRTAAVEFEPFGIRVNAVIPAFNELDTTNATIETDIERFADWALPFCIPTIAPPLNGDAVVHQMPNA